MAYRITELKRLTPPQEMISGWARWRAIVEFWNEDNEKLVITDEVILDRPTQIMKNLGDDDWEIVSKQDTLIEQITSLLDKHEPSYLQRLKEGEKAGYKGSKDPSIHGIDRIDSISTDEKVQSLINKRKSKDDSIKPSS